MGVRNGNAIFACDNDRYNDADTTMLLKVSFNFN